MPPAQWPEPRRLGRGDAPRIECEEQIQLLRSECARIAKGLGITAPTLAPRAALEAIARSRPRTLEEIMKSGGLLRWQAEFVHCAAEKLLTPTQGESTS
jgi:hypothetical protein